ncbi:MAG: uracil-DNA glycosylase [Fervidicoccaceae archaeon]
MSAAEELERLAREIASCSRCALSASRRRAVPGEGPPRAALMIVGEAPGRDEDASGRPFVGRAGRLLTSLLEEVNLKREEAYVTNVVKCRPPGNRAPRRDEVSACAPYLKRQISLVAPRLVLALGALASSSILAMGGETKLAAAKLSELRGKIFRLEIGGLSIALMPTYHPAAALRNPRLLEALRADLARLSEIAAAGSLSA